MSVVASTLRSTTLPNFNLPSRNSKLRVAASCRQARFARVPPAAAMALPRRPLGSTGLEVSVIGFGASPLGSVFQMAHAHSAWVEIQPVQTGIGSEEIDEDEGVASVHEAVKMGINFFDTSPFYGIKRSEQVLGRALKDIPREDIVVSTKVGRYGPEEFIFTAERVTASVNESLERLNIGYIDLIQCHDIEFGDLDQIVEETLPALLKLKEQGLVRHIGITGLPLKVFRYVLDRVPPGTVDVVLSYCHYSLNDQSLAEIIPYLKEKGIGIINASPLSMGLLTKQGPPDWHPAPEEVKKACREAAELCGARGADLARLAIMDSLRNPDIATNLVGMCTREQVAVNLKTALEALGVAQAADPDTDKSVLAEVKELMKPVLGTSWPSGKPENN